MSSVLKPAETHEQVLRIDQTTRIHAALLADKDDKEPVSSWHEVSRPQVHGYDLLGVVSLDPLRFVSIADEKVARVFGAPRSFVNTIRRLGVADLEVDEVRTCQLLVNDPVIQNCVHETGDTSHECERSTPRFVQ